MGRSRIALLALLAATCIIRADDAFSDVFPPTFSFPDVSQEGIQNATDDGTVSNDVVPKWSVSKLHIAAKLSTDGIDLDAITPDTPVEINVGDFSYTGTLADAPDS